MKPSELAQQLRIGNYLQYLSGDTFTVTAQDILNISNWAGNPAYLPKPIPLDAEWYKRCNFYRVDHVHGYSFYTFNRKDKANRGLVDLDINENSTTTGGRTINHIKYLHQLQNVFYALNGIEMPITHTELTKKEI